MSQPRKNPATARTADRAKNGEFGDRVEAEYNPSLIHPQALNWLRDNRDDASQGPFVGQLRTRFGLSLSAAVRLFSHVERERRDRARGQ